MHMYTHTDTVYDINNLSMTMTDVGNNINKLHWAHSISQKHKMSKPWHSSQASREKA